MKTASIFLFVCITSIFSQNIKQNNDTIKYYQYHIIAQNLNIDIVNSYPQEIEKYVSVQSPYEIVIKTFPANQDVERHKLIEMQQIKKKKDMYKYPEEIKTYLEPTALIESDSPQIKAIADTIVNYDLSLIRNIEKILKWVSKTIKYDGDLARRISHGESNTQSAIKTLELKTGTCSEYTNLFIAIMRNIGIPTRFITGIISEKNNTMEHAWAECYFEKIGWHAVDPQTAQIWLPPMGIKLFAGKDFIDCNIKTLPDIKAVVKKINDL